MGVHYTHTGDLGNRGIAEFPYCPSLTPSALAASSTSRLHDLRLGDGKLQVALDQYEQNLRTIVARLKRTGARLIWCSTTPVPEKTDPPRRESDVPAYNAVARKIVDENGIRIDDLHAFALPRLSAIQPPENVHFSSEGSKVLAEHVAASIATVLPSPTAK
jgi:acyl-CoA thioesterase-1